jgi:putative ABC transport system permease protein
MIRLALRTARGRLGGQLATVLVLLAGTTLLTAFAALLDTGLTAHLPANDTLTVLPSILGGWAAAIVVFGVTTTMALTIAHRAREIALLRSIAATPGQVRRLVVAETVLVAVPTVLVGLVPGLLFGSLVLGRLEAFGVVADTVALHAGWLTVVLGGGATLTAALGAASIAGRRAARVAPVQALHAAAEAPADDRPLGRGRRRAGIASLLLGLALGGTTLAMADGPLLASTAGPAGVAVAVGLALLCPPTVTAAGRVLTRLPGAVGRLAGRNITARARRTSTAVGPLILLVGIATGTLYMQATEDASGSSAGAAIASGNYLAVAMIIGFSVIAVVNTLIAATRARCAEYALLRRTGATRRQVYAMATVEATTTATLAIVLGTVAALCTTVPYCLVRTGSPVAAGSPAIYLTIVAATLATALGTTLATTRRVLATGDRRSQPPEASRDDQPE